MPVLTLSYAIHTLDNQKLLAPGARIVKETLDNLISSNKTVSYKSYPLLHHGTVREDIIISLNSLPYHAIFANDRLRDTLKLMEAVRLIPPVLQSLDYFKRYDIYTYRHILVVFSLCTLLAGHLISDHKDLIREAATGPTHDFGKICVPLCILKKASPLTHAERSMLEHHAAAGYVLLNYYYRDAENLSARVARDHHERRDCSGYPCGIALDDKLIEIIAVSDIYDALVSERPYRPVAYDNRTALEEITSMAERDEISWEVVRALVAYNRRNKADLKDVRVSEEKRGASPPGNLYGVTGEEREGPHEV